MCLNTYLVPSWWRDLMVGGGRSLKMDLEVFILVPLSLCSAFWLQILCDQSHLLPADIPLPLWWAASPRIVNHNQPFLKLLLVRHLVIAVRKVSKRKKPRHYGAVYINSQDLVLVIPIHPKNGDFNLQFAGALTEALSYKLSFQTYTTDKVIDYTTGRLGIRTQGCTKPSSYCQVMNLMVHSSPSTPMQEKLNLLEIHLLKHVLSTQPVRVTHSGTDFALSHVFISVG